MRSRTLKLGAVLPSTGLGKDPSAIRDFAHAAEDLGYDFLTTFDHVLAAELARRDPPLPVDIYDETHLFHEPLTTLSYIAAITTRIELATSILILSQRQTALVAKQVAQLQLLSENRFRLGVGTGWSWVEYEALGVSWGDRGRRIDEQIQLLRHLFNEPLVTFEGSFHRIERAAVNPRADGPIPIWVGGSVDAVLDRAARLADGYITPLFGDAGRQPLEHLQERLAAHGRDPEDFPSEIIVDGSMGAEALRAEATAWQEAGGTHISLRNEDATADLFEVPRNNWSSPAEYIASLEDVLDRITSSARAKDFAGWTPPQPTLGELRDSYGGQRVTDEELLCRYLAPAEDVDATRAAGPPSREYELCPTTSPSDLVERALTLGRAAYVRLEQPGFSLTLRRSR